MIIGKHDHPQPVLTQIAGAVGDVGFLLGLGQRWQQHGCQNGDDGNDHQQLNQGEA